MLSLITSAPCITVYQWDSQCHGPAIYFWYFLIYVESLSVCHALLYTSCLCLLFHLFLLWFICYLVVVCLGVCCSLTSPVLRFVPLVSSVFLLLFPVSFWFVLSFFRLPLYLFSPLGALLCCQPLCCLSYYWILALFIKACILFFDLPASVSCIWVLFFFVKHNKQLRRKDSLVPCFEHENCVLRNGVWSWLLQHIWGQ